MAGTVNPQPHTRKEGGTILFPDGPGQDGTDQSAQSEREIQMPKCLRKVPVLYGRNTVFYKGFPSLTVPPVGNHNNNCTLWLQSLQSCPYSN